MGDQAQANALLNAQRRADLQKLPIFYGDDQDQFTAEQWIERINRARNTVDPPWDDNVTMAAVYSSLRKAALAWYEAIQHELDEAHQWRDFQTFFITAWSKTRTSRTTIAALEALHQRMDEKVVNFFARVAKVNKDINEVEPVVLADVNVPNPAFEAVFMNVAAFAAIPAADRMNQARRLVAHGMAMRNDRFAKHVFIAGLKEEIRSDLMKNPPQGGLYAAFQAAQIIEKALEKPSTKSTSSKAVKAIESNEVEVEAVNGGKRYGKRKPMDKKNATCYHCQKKGHFAAECRAKARGEAPAPRPENKGHFKKKNNVSAVDQDGNPFNWLKDDDEGDDNEEVATIHALNY